MLDQFEIASGSFVGRDHTLPLVGRNNQDSFKVVTTDDSITAIVCDGCGSSPHSEVGAKLAASFLAEGISNLLYRAKSELTAPLLHRSGEELLAQIRLLAKSFGGSFTKTITDYFLFTVVGFHLSSDRALLFSVGDGVIIWNGDQIKIGPFENNEPPYLAYRLIKTTLDSQSLQFQVHLSVPVSRVESALIGSDGINDLIAKAESKVPGKNEVVGPISQFWEEDHYFTNPDKVRRRLALLNREHLAPDWETKAIKKEAGLLPDDTTLVVVRRRKGEA